VRPDLTSTIYFPFDSGIPLPTKYDTSPQASYEDNQKTAKYLRKTYKNLINMKNPKIKVSANNFNQNHVVMFYEADGNLTEQIVNYNFNNIHRLCFHW
jgi:DNA anti-recombination protein RmuC